MTNALFLARLNYHLAGTTDERPYQWFPHIQAALDAAWEVANMTDQIDYITVTTTTGHKYTFDVEPTKGTPA